MKLPNFAWLIKKVKKNIALVEDTSTASQNIAAGKYVIWKGKEKKANQAISAGDTLSSTNLDDVTDGIANELNSKIFVKQFSASAGLTANEWVNDIFNIPVPTHVDRIVLNAQNGASGNTGTVTKRSDGKIRISFSVSSSNPIYISGVVDA